MSEISTQNRNLYLARICVIAHTLTCCVPGKKHLCGNINNTKSVLKQRVGFCEVTLSSFGYHYNHIEYQDMLEYHMYP